jgi:hypothetical protein
LFDVTARARFGRRVQGRKLNVATERVQPERPAAQVDYVSYYGRS